MSQNVEAPALRTKESRLFILPVLYVVVYLSLEWCHASVCVMYTISKLLLPVLVKMCDCVGQISELLTLSNVFVSLCLAGFVH